MNIARDCKVARALSAASAHEESNILASSDLRTDRCADLMGALIFWRVSGHCFRFARPTAKGERVRIIGIDPGTLNTGYGIIEECGNALRFIACGTIKARGNDLAQRLVLIHRGLCEAIAIYTPEEAAVETVYTGINPKTAIAIGEGRGVALLSAAEAGLRVVGYEPSVVKRAVTATGKADKAQVQQMVKVLLALPELPKTDHESDALALAITHSRRRKMEALTAGQIAPQRNAQGATSPRQRRSYKKLS